MNEEKDNLYYKISFLKSLDNDIREYHTIDKSSAYQNTQKKISKQTRKVRILQFMNRAAAILIIPLLISTGILFLRNGEYEKSPQGFIEVTAAPGTIIKTQLPDLSEVWLNSESSLRYPSSFKSGKRIVELSGEAFFAVKADSENLFEVNTPSGVKITAKGTSFNVNAYENDPIHEMALQDGIIEVSHGNSSYTLHPSEITYFNTETDQLIKNKTNIDEKTGWKDGLLVFRNTPIDDVFKKLSRRYNVDIILHKKTNTEYKVRATFSSENITQILNVLKVAAPMTWAIREIQQNKDLTYSRQQIEVWIE